MATTPIAKRKLYKVLTSKTNSEKKLIFPLLNMQRSFKLEFEVSWNVLAVAKLAQKLQKFCKVFGRQEYVMDKFFLSPLKNFNFS